MTAADRKRCSHCKKPKPLAAFYWEPRRGRWSSVCLTCRRIKKALSRETAAVIASEAAYRARPDVKARRKEADRLRHERTRAERAGALAAYRGTPRGRLMRGRQDANRRLRQAGTPARVASASALVESYEREIRRYDERQART